MTDRRVCLEAVEFSSGRTPRRAASAWLSQGALMSLLERLAVKDVRTRGAPAFDWVLNSGYVFRVDGAPPGSDEVTQEITSENPIPFLCVEPAIVALGLQWVGAAIRDDVLLDRLAVWNALRMAGEFDEGRFVGEFAEDIGKWLAVCELATQIDGKVTLRVDAVTLPL